jgi:hypothetical protein
LTPPPSPQGPLWTGTLTDAQLTLSRHYQVGTWHGGVLGVHESLWVRDSTFGEVCVPSPSRTSERDGTREEPGTLTQGGALFSRCVFITGSSRCVCLLLQDLVQSCSRGGGGEYGRTCSTRDEPGTREEPGTLIQVRLFSLVPHVWESNPKLQGGWCKIQPPGR